MIRYLAQEEKQKTIPLYREAFPEDSDSFLEYYYKEKVKDNRILAAEETDDTGENGRIVSMVHQNPYELQVRGQKWTGVYLVAAATTKDRRRRGLCRSLFKQTMEDLYEEGREFCYLMPADSRIYKPLEFAYIYDQPHWILKEEAERGVTVRKVQAEEKEIAETADWMNRWLESRYQVFARRTEGYVRQLMTELESENGWLEILCKPSCARQRAHRHMMKGWRAHLASLNSSRLSAADFHSKGNGCGTAGKDTRVSTQQWIGIRGWWGIGRTEQRLLYCQEPYRETAGEATPIIMARIVHLGNFLKAIHLKNDCPESGETFTVRLTVTDSLCQENNGTFLWKIRKEGSELLPWNPEMEADVSLKAGISELTEWLFGYEKGTYKKEPWMEQIQALDRVFLDEVV